MQRAASAWPCSRTCCLRCLLPPPQPLRLSLRVRAQGATWPLRPLAACLRGCAVAIPGNAAHPGAAPLAARCGFAAAFARRVICSRAGVGFGTQRRDHTYYLNTTAKGSEGGKKKGERKKTHMKYLLRFEDTHTHTHTTQTHQPGSGSLAAEEGRLWLRLSSKPCWRQNLLKGNPLGQN